MEKLTERYKDSIANIVLIRECGDKLCKDICDDIECDCSKCELEKALEKLADYEDLEEQGLLVRLPCKVGDLVFIIDGENICRRKVKSIKILSAAIEISTSDIIFHKESFGETVFLTREEAVNKLEELKNEI